MRRTLQAETREQAVQAITNSDRILRRMGELEKRAIALSGQHERAERRGNGAEAERLRRQIAANAELIAVGRFEQEMAILAARRAKSVF